jgi:hypothetical protein
MTFIINPNGAFAQQQNKNDQPLEVLHSCGIFRNADNVRMRSASHGNAFSNAQSIHMLFRRGQLQGKCGALRIVDAEKKRSQSASAGYKNPAS